MGKVYSSYPYNSKKRFIIKRFNSVVFPAKRLHRTRDLSFNIKNNGT